MSVTKLNRVGILYTLLFHFHAGMAGNYWDDRKKLLKEDERCSLGANIILSDAEQKANQILMINKRREITEGFSEPEKFLAAQHFFKAKHGIDNSEVFKILQKLPKGTSLHSHDMALTSQEFLYQLTFEPNLYANINKGNMRLRFFSAGYNDSDWTLVSKLRSTDPNFEDFLKSHLTLIVNDPQKEYPSINAVWTAFAHIFGTVLEMLTYKPVWQKFFYQALKELYEDNVRYVEFRCVLPEVYDLNGKTYNATEVVGLYDETLTQFKHDYPDFWGARIIYAPLRRVTNETMYHYVDIFHDLKRNYPDFIAGFDLVGQEDLGKSAY